MKVLEYLKSKGQPIPHRDLYRSLNMSAKELDMVVEPLVKLGIIRISYKQSGTGKSLRILEAF